MDLGKAADLTGRRFGRLIVIERTPDKGGRTAWKCLCDCGTSKVVNGASVLRGSTRSCGCLRRESARRNAAANLTHGMHGTRTYKSYRCMLDRCNNPKAKTYPRYGGRGIIVCDRWSGPDGFANFHADLGDCPDGLCLDRIDNTGGGYRPDNCRWVTPKQQANNRTSNVRITYKGRTQSRQQWADEIGLNASTLDGRLKRGWAVGVALGFVPRKSK